MIRTARLVFCLALALGARTAAAIDSSVPAIGGDFSRANLGDGTGVVIGIIDSGVDATHPALAGNDSLGNPRLVAQANFSGDPGTGDDFYGHGTQVATAALSSDPIFTGMASDARFVNARVLDDDNGFDSGFQVMDGLGFAIEQGSHVVNLSLNFNLPMSTGNNALDLMVDWAAYERNVHAAVCVGNIPGGGSPAFVRSPGSAYNGITVGRTTADFSRVHANSAIAPTADGRSKPDVVAPGTSLTLANDDWEGGSLWDNGLGGCSFATPHVAGMMAQQIEYGVTNGLSTSPLVVKATLLNSAVKVLDKGGAAWEPADSAEVGGVLMVDSPLDSHSGAGQIDGRRLFDQYSAGQQSAGLVDAIGWDLATVAGTNSIDYVIDDDLVAGSTLDVTLTWARHVGRTDDGNGIIDSGDTFNLLESVDNLDLAVLLDGNPLAISQSTIDNVEHLHLALAQQGEYTIRVSRLAVANTGADEQFALAWSGVAVPEPSSLLLAALGGLAVAVLVWRRRR